MRERETERENEEKWILIDKSKRQSTNFKNDQKLKMSLNEEAFNTSKNTFFLKRILLSSTKTSVFKKLTEQNGNVTYRKGAG